MSAAAAKPTTTGTAVAGDDPTTDAGQDQTADAPAGEPASVRIASVQAWDPDGDNGSENDAQAIGLLCQDRVQHMDRL